MELNIFMKELESALVERGIPDETAKKHVSNLRRTFTSDDLSEIEAIHSKSEIEQLADSIAVILNKNKRTVQAQAEPSPVEKYEKPHPSMSAASENMPRSPAPTPKPHPAVRQQQVQRKPLEIPYEDDYFEYSEGADGTTKGMIIFWVGLLITLPITLALAAVIFGAFALVFVGLSALIVGLIAALIAIVAVGAGLSLVGIIFGITQLFSFMAAGIYEIGLGIMVAGAVLFVSVLLYNIAIRLLPWLISLVGNFLGFVCGKLKTLFLNIRRECYKL